MAKTKREQKFNRIDKYQRRINGVWTDVKAHDRSNPFTSRGAKRK